MIVEFFYGGELTQQWQTPLNCHIINYSEIVEPVSMIS